MKSGQLRLRNHHHDGHDRADERDHGKQVNALSNTYMPSLSVRHGPPALPSIALPAGGRDRRIGTSVVGVEPYANADARNYAPDEYQ